MTEGEQELYRAARLVMQRVGFEPSVDRHRPPSDRQRNNLEIESSGRDEVMRHISFDLLSPGFAFKFQLELPIWAACGRLGSWTTDAAAPICSECLTTLEDADRLWRMYRFGHAVAVIGVAGASNGNAVTGMLARYAAIGALAAMFCQRTDEAAMLLEITDAVVAMLDAEINGLPRSPLRDGTDALISMFEERSGHRLSDFTDEAHWVVLDEKDGAGEPDR
jgi:hypothetical protein